MIMMPGPTQLAGTVTGTGRGPGGSSEARGPGPYSELSAAGAFPLSFASGPALEPRLCVTFRVTSRRPGRLTQCSLAAAALLPGLRPGRASAAEARLEPAPVTVDSDPDVADPAEPIMDGP
jgi:hypothetical protein